MAGHMTGIIRFPSPWVELGSTRVREVYVDIRVTWQATRKANRIQTPFKIISLLPCAHVDAVVKRKVLYTVRLNRSNQPLPAASEGSPEPRPKTESADLGAPLRASST